MDGLEEEVRNYKLEKFLIGKEFCFRGKSCIIAKRDCMYGLLRNDSWVLEQGVGRIAYSDIGRLETALANEIRNNKDSYFVDNKEDTDKLQVGSIVTLYDKKYIICEEYVHNGKMYFLTELSNNSSSYGFVDDSGYCYTRFYSLLELEKAINEEIKEEKEEIGGKLIKEDMKEKDYGFNIGNDFILKGVTCRIEDDGDSFYVINTKDNNRLIFETSSGLKAQFESLSELESLIYKELKNDSMKKEESQFQDITDSISELLRVKNQRYGACYIDRLKIFEGKCANGQRIDEKLSRIKNSDELRLNDLADVVGYLVLTIDELGYKGEDILKLID